MNTPGRCNESGANFGRYALEQHSYQVLSCLTKSSCFRRVIGLWSHCIRLMESCKADCFGALQRKTLQSSPSAFSSALSPVRFQSDSSEIAPIFRNFQRNPGGFLCTSDCVAEREGFEPSVRFCRAKPRRVRKLQIAKPSQRISRQNPRSELCNQSGFDSPSIRTRKRTSGDSVAESGHFANCQAT